MTTAIESALDITRLLAGQPERIAGVAVFFLAAYGTLRWLRSKASWPRPWPALIPAFLFGLWTLWEYSVGDSNIRVDLLFGGPLLLLVTLASVVGCIRFGATRGEN